MADQSQGRSAFDPRFDPAFQPGYDAAADPDARARTRRGGPVVDDRASTDPSRTSPQSASVSASAVAPPSAAQPPQPLPASAPRAPGTDSRATSSPDGSGEQESDGTAAAPALRDLTRNPFVIGLWVISVVFIIVGGGLLRWVSMALDALNNSGDAGFDFLLVQALQFGGPLFIVLGCAVATATLFLFASRWRASPRE